MELKIKNLADYHSRVKLAQDNPDNYWAALAENFYWFKKWQKISNCNFSQGKNAWFIGGKTNISYNALDSNLKDRAKQNALIWESNNPDEESRYYNYQQLHEQTCKFANLLTAKQIKQGDRVCIYMPMIPEAIIAMLACARIGAIHTVVFAGFSANALKERLADSTAKLIITADLLNRGDKKINLLEIVNEAILDNDQINDIILYQRTEKKANSSKNIVVWQHEISKYSSENKAIEIDAEDPLFILYTSGSTGKPKGILHSTAGYMVYAAYSFQNVFQYQEKEVFLYG